MGGCPLLGLMMWRISKEEPCLQMLPQPSVTGSLLDQPCRDPPVYEAFCPGSLRLCKPGRNFWRVLTVMGISQRKKKAEAVIACRWKWVNGCQGWVMSRETILSEKPVRRGLPGPSLGEPVWCPLRKEKFLSCETSTFPLTANKTFVFLLFTQHRRIFRFSNDKIFLWERI